MKQNYNVNKECKEKRKGNSLKPSKKVYKKERKRQNWSKNFSWIYEPFISNDGDAPPSKKRKLNL